MTQSTSDTDDKTTLAANCYDCGDEHPVGDRQMGELTTICPHCGSPRYRTVSYGEKVIKSDEERIADAVHDVSGVGSQTQENIISAFGSYYEFEAADEDTLQSIEGVGKQTAKRIVENR